MKIRLTESDLKNLVSSVVKRILREEVNNNSILGKIVERLSNMDIQAKHGENDVQVPLDDEGNVIVFIDFTINDNRYLVKVDAPDGPWDEPEGDFELQITALIVMDEDGNETPIEDNGMVANALKELVTLDNSELDYPTPDYDDGW